MIRGGVGNVNMEFILPKRTETLRMSPVGGQSLKENSLVCFLSLEIQCNQTHVIPPVCLDHQEAQKSYFSHSIVIAAHNLSVGHIVVLSYHQLLFGLKFSLCNTDYFLFLSELLLHLSPQLSSYTCQDMSAKMV